MAKKINRVKEKTKNNKKRLIEAFKTRPFSVGKNCEAVGLARVTYYDYLNNDEEFRDAIEQCKQDYTDKMLDLADDVHIRAMTESDKEGNVTPAGISAANYVKNNLGKQRGWNVKDKDESQEQRPEIVITVKNE